MGKKRLIAETGAGQHGARSAVGMTVGDGATLDEIEINEVTVDADVVEVNYTLSFSAYLGCSDRTWADVESGRVYGMKRGMPGSSNDTHLTNRARPPMSSRSKNNIAKRNAVVMRRA